MTETYTSSTSTHGNIKKLDSEHIQLGMDDKLFFDFLKPKMNTLFRQPGLDCVDRITAYSKAWRASN